MPIRLFFALLLLISASAGTARAAADLSSFRTGTLQNLTLHKERIPVPEALFLDKDGKQRSLDEFRGKVVLLNVWATWCAPCRYEMPALDRLQAAMANDDFTVLAMSIDRRGIPKVEQFFRELKLRALSIFVDPTGRSARRMGVVGLPTTLLIDRQGREIGRLIGPAEWDRDEVKKLISAIVAE